MGSFHRNHNNVRFLYPDIRMTKKELENDNVFIVFWKGIPVIYQEDKKYFNRGCDPGSREILFKSGYQITIYLHIIRIKYWLNNIKYINLNYIELFIHVNYLKIIKL